MTYYMFDDGTIIHEDDIDEYLVDNQTLHYETYFIPHILLTFIEDAR